MCHFLWYSVFGIHSVEYDVNVGRFSGFRFLVHVAMLDKCFMVRWQKLLWIRWTMFNFLCLRFAIWSGLKPSCFICHFGLRDPLIYLRFDSGIHIIYSLMWRKFDGFSLFSFVSFSCNFLSRECVLIFIHFTSKIPNVISEATRHSFAFSDMDFNLFSEQKENFYPGRKSCWRIFYFHFFSFFFKNKKPKRGHVKNSFNLCFFGFF